MKKSNKGNYMKYENYMTSENIDKIVNNCTYIRYLDFSSKKDLKFAKSLLKEAKKEMKKINNYIDDCKLKMEKK